MPTETGGIGSRTAHLMCTEEVSRLHSANTTRFGKHMSTGPSLTNHIHRFTADLTTLSRIRHDLSTQAAHQKRGSDPAAVRLWHGSATTGTEALQ